MGEKEYNYIYNEGTLIEAITYSIELNDEIVVGKSILHTLRYVYDDEGKQTKKILSLADGTEQVYLAADESNSTSEFIVGDNSIKTHSKTDSFGRKIFDEFQLGSGFISRQFSYHAGEEAREHKENEKLMSSPTTQLVSEILLSDGRTLSYEYDAEERITSVTESYKTADNKTITNITEYTYDALGQLLTEMVNGEIVNTMKYDNYGNIIEKNGKAYTYGNATWKDLLTGFDGKTIEYDAQGNPVKYLGHTLTWEKGRQLKSFDGNTYTYNANGIRTSKTVNGIKHEYTLDGTKILRETWGDNTLIPLYDNEDSVCGILYNSVPYYFIKNLQGDIIAIVNKDAQTVARYSYDAWGVCTVTQDSVGIATINPLRYRGYYYDEEIGLYYLQSRYYDPCINRFVNSDHPSILKNQSLYTYCDNAPPINVDFYGYTSCYILGHKIQLIDVGFLVDVSDCFLIKEHTLDLSNQIIKKYGSNKKYKDMDNVRIAKELLAHAVLYYIGVGISLVAKLYEISTENIVGYLPQIYTLQYLIFKITANYLISHSEEIHVNNNESKFRLSVYSTIWTLMPYIKGKCTNRVITLSISSGYSSFIYTRGISSRFTCVCLR